MGLLAFCANAAALSQGKWVAWPKCQGCARRLDGSDWTKAAGVAAPGGRIDLSLCTASRSREDKSADKLSAASKGTRSRRVVPSAKSM